MAIDQNAYPSIEALKGETVMAEEETRIEDEPRETESLKVRTNLKAGSDPETPGAAPSTDPIIITGG
jgi:hypothetical protein